MNRMDFVITCRQCQSRFYICKSCFRGHVYCSPTCKKIGYSARQRIARKKHASSLEGKLDNADRNKKYRQKIKQNNVTDKTSKKLKVDLQQLKISLQQKNFICIACKKQFIKGHYFYERSLQVSFLSWTGPPG